MKSKTTVLLIAAILLTACRSTDDGIPKSTFGWTSVNPPRENVLGREVLANGVFGDQIIKFTPDDIEVSDSVHSLTDSQFSKAEASFDLIVKGASVALGYENTKSKKLSSTNWKISQIRNFAYTVPVNRKFAFQCLTASKYEFTASKKTGVDAAVDATKIAEKFGVDTAKVTFKTIPNNPSEFTVMIDNPSVCLSFVSAYFKDNNFTLSGRISDKYVDITGVKGSEKYSVDFELKPGEKSNFRSPQFSGIEPPFKPLYRLMAVLGSDNLVKLAVCRQDKGVEDRGYRCNESVIEDDGYGNWDRPYHIDTFSYGKLNYKVIYLNINAKRTPDGTIKVSSAKLQYPQYTLEIN